MPCLRLSRGDAISTSRPCIRMVPASLAWTPAMILISVDLPAPFSPISACTLPGASVRSTFSSATTPGNRLPMPSISNPPTSMAAVPTKAGCRSAGIGFAPHGIEIGRQNDDDARTDHLQVLVPAVEDDAVVDDFQHQHTEQCAEKRATAASQAGSAQNDSGNDRELEAAPGRRLTGIHQRRQDHAGHADAQAGQDEGEQFQPFGTDT